MIFTVAVVVRSLLVNGSCAHEKLWMCIKWGNGFVCLRVRTIGIGMRASENEHDLIRQQEFLCWKSDVLQPWVHSSCILRRRRARELLFRRSIVDWLSAIVCSIHSISSYPYSVNSGMHEHIYTKQFNNSLFSHRFCASFAKSIFVRSFAFVFGRCDDRIAFWSQLQCERIDSKNYVRAIVTMLRLRLRRLHASYSSSPCSQSEKQ